MEIPLEPQKFVFWTLFVTATARQTDRQADSFICTMIIKDIYTGQFVHLNN